MSESEHKSRVTEKKWRIITVTISIIALVVSVPISIKSCSDSTEALRFSKETFEETQKPELALRPVNKDGKSTYVKYIDHNDSLDIIIFIRILNIGKRPATNIIYPNTKMSVNIRGREITSEDVDLNFPISLSSQQHYFRKNKLSVKSFGSNSQQIIKELISGNIAVNINISVKYTDAITLQEFIVSAEYSVQRENFDILKYNHPQLASN